MAEAVKQTRSKTIQVSDGVTLFLSDEEAFTLKAILSRVGGPIKTSPRGHADNIRHTLVDAGYALNLSETTVLMGSTFESGITFLENTLHIIEDREVK